MFYIISPSTICLQLDFGVTMREKLKARMARDASKAMVKAAAATPPPDHDDEEEDPMPSLSKPEDPKKAKKREKKAKKKAEKERLKRYLPCDLRCKYHVPYARPLQLLTIINPDIYACLNSRVII